MEEKGRGGGVRERDVKKILVIAGSEAGGREPEAKECWQPLEAEINYWITASKKMGTLVVLQLQRTEFCQ